MKILLLLSVLLFPMLLTAQDDEIDLPFDNEPIKQKSLEYFVLAGGVTYDFLMIKDDDLNSFLVGNSSELPDELLLSGSIQLLGGQCVVGVPWVKNLRIGVFGYGGSKESGTLDLPTIVFTPNPEPSRSHSQRTLTASMFGFSLHYGYVPFEHFAVLGGVNTGWGDITHEMSGSVVNQDRVTYQENSPYSSGMNRLDKNFFFAMPNIQLEYALANFIILRVDASYNLTFAQDDKWTFNNLGTSSENSDLDLSGLKVGFGIMIGLANF